MLQRKPKNHTVIDMYKAWSAGQLKENSNYFARSDRQVRIKGIRIIYKIVDRRPVLVMSYIMFRLIIEMYNKYAAEAIIHGHKFDLNGGLGYLYPARIERSFSRPKFDVISTCQTRKTIPDHPPIYHLSPDYCMVKWQKYFKTRNESVYTFITAKESFRKDFSIANKKNPILKTNYKFIPLQRHQEQQSA